MELAHILQEYGYPVEPVQAAIHETNSMKTGKVRMGIVEMVLMHGSYSLEGAALKSYVSYATPD